MAEVQGSVRGVRRRNPRGQGDRLREEIIAVASELIAESGDADQLSLRAVANRIGIAAPSIYRHFADVEHLKMAVVERSFATFNEARDIASASITDPVEALQARCRTYCRFALEYRGPYRFMFSHQAPPANPAEPSAGNAAFQALAHSIERCQEAGRARATDDPLLSCCPSMGGPARTGASPHESARLSVACLGRGNGGTIRRPTAHPRLNPAPRSTPRMVASQSVRNAVLPSQQHQMEIYVTTTSTLHPEPNPAPVGVQALHDPPRTSVGGDRLRLLAPGSRAHRALLTAALLGGLLFNLTVWVDGFFRPGYNAFRQPESALSLGPGGWVQVTNFIVFGFLNLCFALALRKTLAPGRGSTWAPVLQGIAGLSMIIVGIFVEDPSKGYPIGVVPPVSATLHGSIHTSATFVALIATVAFLFVLASRLSVERGWRGWPTWLRTAAVLMMALLAAFGVAMAGHGPAGLFEKAASIAVTVPGTVFLIRVLRRGGRLRYAVSRDVGQQKGRS